ncbi:MAG: hypothetical protein HRU15_15340 [Planctomycetes bacterium]|nr:hypothetical protein [Planctomycetota bacterium]
MDNDPTTHLHKFFFGDYAKPHLLHQVIRISFRDIRDTGQHQRMHINIR